MPVTVANFNPMAKLKEIGVDSTLLAKVSAAGGLLKVMPNKLVLTLSSKNYDYEVQVHVLLSAAKGELNQAQRQALCEKLNGFLTNSLDGTWTTGGFSTESKPFAGSKHFVASSDAPKTYSVTLTAVGPMKINVIKIVRTETGCSLKDAKDLVDAVEVGKPQKVKSGLTIEAATQLVAHFCKETAMAVVNADNPIADLITELKSAVQTSAKPALEVKAGEFSNEKYQHVVAAMAQHQPISETSLKTATTVPLVDAVGLYRPVRGTDHSSRYFLIAVFEGGMKMACRLSSSKMSLRVEGPVETLASKKVQAALSGLGFKPSNPHWSAHMAPGSIETAQRFVGCALMSIPGLLTPLPDLNVIANKGSG